MTEQLKPCPFCGGEADIDHDHTVEESHGYGCRHCGIWFDSSNSDDEIASWNTRATPTPAEAARVLVENKAMLWDALAGRSINAAYLCNALRAIAEGESDD